MNKLFIKIINNKKITIIFLFLFAFLINWYSANLGVMPIDTFAFFDSSYSILKNKLPIRDFWITTGLTVDYFQAFFFKILGPNWRSYVVHSSLINSLTSITFYFFLKNYNLNKYFTLIYSISFAILCYPVSGTPFAYLHSYAFSLIIIFLFFIAINKNYKIIWFLLPLIFLLAFFSMQTPSIYIILLISIYSIFYFIKFKKKKEFYFFVLGNFSSLFLFFLFIYLTKTPLIDLLYQYFLFPISIAEGRFSSDLTAYVRLSDQINFKRIFGDFKFIHIFLSPLIFIFLYSILKDKKFFLLNSIILISVFLFIFNQINQANQIYIFSLIPLIASVLNININYYNFDKKLIYLILIFLFFSTFKYYDRYNLNRKFLDIENFDKSLAIDAQIIDKKLKNLKWITPSYVFKDSVEEIETIKLALETIKEDNRNILIITHYQFFSLLLEKKINILNRWYLWDNNSHPTENHKYFRFYKNFVDKKMDIENIEVIYLLGFQNRHFLKLNKYFDNKCFNNYTLVENKFSQHNLINCKN